VFQRFHNLSARETERALTEQSEPGVSGHGRQAPELQFPGVVQLPRSSPILQPQLKSCKAKRKQHSRLSSEQASKQASKVTQFTAGSRKQRLDHPVIIAVVVATAVAHLWVVAMVVVGEVAGTAVAVATAGNRHARPHGAGRRGARVDEHRLGHRYAA
jgi:hypothetical protein